jgi:hypothetical protein
MCCRFHLPDRMHIAIGLLTLIIAWPCRSSAQTLTLSSSPEETARQLDALLQQEMLLQQETLLQQGVGASESGSTEANKTPRRRKRPSPAINDYGFLRRASLDITGRIPSLRQIESFIVDETLDKRSSLIDQLLNDPRYGENWARYWRDVIMYRRTEDRGLLAANPVTTFLTDAFNEDIPWDVIARSFITAQGDIREQGQTAIVAAHGGRPEESVAELARIFLGVQIQCAQCHDHPTDRWSREQFHELAAFYPRTFMRPQRMGDKRSFVVTHRDRAARARRKNNDRHIGNVEHYMPDLDNPTAKGTVMEPVFFLTGQRLELGASDEQRRGALAEWVTSPSNEWFAKALVGRIWNELMGDGFYAQVDDIGPDREAVYPQTLEYLATSFVSAGYDMKWLLKVIMSTELYHRKSRSRGDVSELALMTPLQQRLRSDQVFNALIQFLSFDQPMLRKRMDQTGRRGPRTAFAAAFGYDPSEPREDIGGSVPQALLLMNGPMIQRLVTADRVGGLARLLRTEPDNAKLVRELYLRALTREPSRRELASVEGHLRKSNGRTEAFEDLIWALINSSEFIHRG